MKTLLLFVIICSAAAIPAVAQSTYQLDNFDFNRVTIQAPPPEPIRKSVPKRLTNRANSKYQSRAEETIQLTSLNVNPSLGGFTTGNAQVDNLIVESGRRNSVDPLLLYSIMHQESTFKARAVSSKGARGLMQLMPMTALRFGVTNIFDPRQNIEGGARYMRFLLNLFSGDVKLALAGYNAGEGAVMKYGFQVPPYSETQEYVRRIGRRYSLIRDPLAAAHANNLNAAELATARQKDSAPLTIYERSVFATRLPDGRLQLISQ
ncbi:MAG: lytic transglycosylase domain-containing protein [Pyrinomonadaceae bacterium]